VTLADARQCKGQCVICGLAHDAGFFERRHTPPGLDLEAFHVGARVSREDRRAVAGVELSHCSIIERTEPRGFRRVEFSPHSQDPLNVSLMTQVLTRSAIPLSIGVPFPWWSRAVDRPSSTKTRSGVRNPRAVSPTPMTSTASVPTKPNESRPGNERRPAEEVQQRRGAIVEQCPTNAEGVGPLLSNPARNGQWLRGFLTRGRPQKIHRCR
jgi:hypothetical protein